MKARGGALGRPGAEIARWRRDDLSVSWKPFGFLLKVTIVAGGEQHECSATKHRLVEQFLARMTA